MQQDNPIDIVYLWVDGQDPAWRGKRRLAAQRLSADHRSAIGLHGNVEGRFRDNDELRYSLRALERFFPAHGHVYLVTDGQTPAWLRPSDRLTLVDHRDLIPAAQLPTFDSGNIESYIHRIPTLSERFLYLNDDVFFGAPVRTEDWFWDAGVYAAWSDDAVVADGPLRQDANSMDNATRLSRQWLDAPCADRPALSGDAPARLPGYTHTSRTFAHAPRPLLRSVLFELEALAPELFAGVRSTVFRTWDQPTLVADFVIRWALAHGITRMRDYRHSYLSTGDADIGRQLDRLVRAAEGVDFFCINDTTDNAPSHDARLARVRESLQQMFPRPSSFERPVARVKAVAGELRGAEPQAAARRQTALL
jgi:hypothetical protein